MTKEDIVEKILRKLCDNYIHHTIAGNPSEWKKVTDDIAQARKELVEWVRGHKQSIKTINLERVDNKSVDIGEEYNQALDDLIAEMEMK